MNKQFIRYMLGYILLIIGGLMGLPLLVSLLYQEPIRYPLSFLLTALLTMLVGFHLSRTELETRRFYAKEGFVIVSLSWILASLFGAIPFVLSGDIPSFMDAFFEMASGFTTTGASILTDVEALAHSMLFWRSFTHFIGGMGVLVFALAILPQAESGSVHIMKAEMPGPTFGKLVSRLSSSARILYIIYFVLMVAIILLLWLAGAPFFDSILLAFGTAGTGGFGVVNGSVAPYDNFAIEFILSIGMLAFGVNFNLYYMMLNQQFKKALHSEELKWYLGIIGISVLLITMNLVTNSYGLGASLRDSFFTVSSVLTTTGFSTALFDNWPLFSRLLLLILMFFGGMAGSTAGGLKISRIMILMKSSWAEIKRTVRPNRIVTIRSEDRRIDLEVSNAIFSYLAIYIIIFVLAMLLVIFETPDFISAFSTVAATINNIGPGFGIVGPSQSYAAFSPMIKLVLSFVMIMGRLEIFPILILLAPNTWKKRM
ncbi:MAG TPA: TrkH family potassium uptake protein [Atopostipes sp.]|nr:TrkH family potassium uptake protein [Atopostipes sp.]